jgi:hypothetical protein
VLVSECIIWPGQKTSAGYGLYRMRYAHRLVHEALVAPLRPGQVVCHVCDNPPCVNPDHLFAGSQKDNIQDASRKGRTPQGERQGCSKLTKADVLEIRKAERPGRVLAAEFGVSQSTICDIQKRRTWAHVAT